MQRVLMSLFSQCRYCRMYFWLKRFLKFNFINIHASAVLHTRLSGTRTKVILLHDCKKFYQINWIKSIESNQLNEINWIKSIEWDHFYQITFIKLILSNQFHQINWIKSILSNPFHQINFIKWISSNKFHQINFIK